MKSAPVTAQHVIFLTEVRVRNQLAGAVSAQLHRNENVGFGGASAG